MNSNLLTVSNDNVADESQVNSLLSLTLKENIETESRGFLDRIFYWKSHGILKKGNQTPLELKDLPSIPKDIRYNSLIPKLKSILKTPGISLYWAFTRLISFNLLLFFFFCLIAETIGILIPFVLKEFINRIDHFVRHSHMEELNRKSFCFHIFN